MIIFPSIDDIIKNARGFLTRALSTERDLTNLEWVVYKCNLVMYNCSVTKVTCVCVLCFVCLISIAFMILLHCIFSILFYQPSLTHPDAKMLFRAFSMYYDKVPYAISNRPPGNNFAHGMTVQLSWHIQNCELIWVTVFIVSVTRVFIRFGLCALKLFVKWVTGRPHHVSGSAWRSLKFICIKFMARCIFWRQIDSNDAT